MPLAALLLLTATAFQNAADAPRIEVRAEPLERALPEIGQSLGVPMRAAPAVGRELVLASFASRDAAAFRDELAKAFAGEWSLDPNGVWTFNRSILQRDAERKANHERRLEAIAKGLAKARKNANPDTDFTPDEADRLAKDLKGFMELPQPQQDRYDAAYYRKARGLDQRGPSNRVVRRIMNRLPVDQLETGNESARVVYSTRPTRMQVAMPFDIMPEIRRYVREQNVWSAAMDGSGISEPTNGGGVYTSLMYRRERAEKIPAVALLIIQDQYGSRQVTVRAYDSKGEQLLDESESVNYYDSEQNEEAAKRVKENPRPIKVTLSPESQRFSEVFDFNAQRRKEKGITPADAAPFMDVVARDPLSYGASEVAFAIARAENRNLLARLDDSLYYLSYSLSEPETMKKGLDASVLDYFTSATEENGWTRLGPKDVQNSERTFYDRKQLARALAVLAQGGRMTVERQAEIATLMPDDPSEKPMYSLVQLFSGNRYYGGDEIMRLYGTMTPDQRKAAQSDVGIAFSSLSVASMAVLQKIAYQSDEWRLQYNPTPELQQSFKNGQDPDQQMFWNGYLRESTFSLPDGLRGTGRVKVVTDTGDKVRTGPVTRRWGTQDGETMTPEDLANNWYQAQNPRRFPWSQNEWSRRNFESMTLVNQQSVNVEVRFSDRITTNSVLTSDLDIVGGPYTLKTLPKEFQERFAKMIKQLDEQYKDQPFPDPNDYQRYNQGGRQVTPP